MASRRGEPRAAAREWPLRVVTKRRVVGVCTRLLAAVAIGASASRASCWLPTPAGPSRRVAASLLGSGVLTGALGGPSAANAEQKLETLYTLETGDGKDTYTRYDADGNLQDIVKAKIQQRVIREPNENPAFCRAADRGDLLSIRYSVAYELEGGKAAAAKFGEEDTPYDYMITKPAIVSSTKELGGAKIGEIPVGTEMKIAEVDISDKRVRGRITNPDGWISLKNTEDGSRWAQKMVDEPLLDLLARPKAPGPRWKVYDSSDKRAPGMPYRVPLGDGTVIPGVDIGLLGMCEGEKRVMYIPSSLAFGSKGSEVFGVPPNANLRYDVELLNVLVMPRKGQVQDTRRKIQGEQIP